MKKKLFLLLCTLLTMIGVQAQTDVTSTYLTNADFSSSTPIGSNLKGYGKDGTPYGFQTVDGWTSVVTNGDNSNATYPNSGMAAAVFAYGSSYQLQGNNKAAPATNPDGEATGNCFGFFGVWGCGGYYYQNVTFPAGRYTITVPMYSQSGTQANTTYTGFFPTSGTDRTIAVNPTVGQWANQSVTFTLTEETAGQIRIGYQSTGSGSGANPHIFIDRVKIEYTDPNLSAAQIKLGGYIQKATALNGVFDDSDLETAISEAQDVLDDAITAAACNTASDNLSAAITTALSGKTPVSLTNGNFNTTPNNTLNGDKSTTFGGTLSTSTSNPDNTKDMSANTGDHAYLYDVTGWTQYSKFNSTAAQGTTSEYGTAMPANGWSTNSTTPPDADMFGGTTGAALHLSAGWSDQARYQQTIENLPSGRYVLYYEVINKHSNTGIASNYIGVNGTSGDFYGTTNNSIYSGLKTIEQDVWKAQAFEFDVAKTANINFSVGVTTSTSGSADGAKLWIDNILVYRIADIIVTEEDANAIIASAEALNDVKFNATDKANLAEKLSNFKAAKNLDNYNALFAAIADAEASVANYAALKAAIDKANDVLEANNFVTAAATTAFENEINAATTAWTDGTYSDAEALAEINTLGSAVSGWQAIDDSGKAGSFMASAWGKTHENWWSAPYINTWSTEGDNDGSGFSVPFFEYFANADQNLGTNTFTATLTGLSNGVYEVELWARVQRRSNADFNADNSFITMNVNGGEAVSIMSDTEHTVGTGGSVMRLGHYTARGEVTDGTLTLSIDVKNGSNVHWLSWRDIKYTKLDEANMAVNAEAQWGTFCAPFAVAIPSGVTAYTCESATAGVLNLVEVNTTIPANTPVILNAESGLASTTFYGKKVDNESDDLIEGGMLRGNVSSTAKNITYTGNEYLLQRNNDKTGFYKMDNANTYKVGYNRCYLVMDSNQGGNAREAFFFEDDATAISALEAAKAEDGALKDGKYLIGNKVVIVKNGVKYGASGQKLN